MQMEFTMANLSKQKGTRAETAVVKYLQSLGIEAERRALSGSEDKGDIKVQLPYHELTLEIKAGKQTSNPSRTQVEEWLHQMRAEGAHADCLCALVIVRYNRKLTSAEVYMPLEGEEAVFCFAYLDQMVHMWMKNY